MEIQFKYEVAFSFLQQDESLAFAISDLINDHFSTFIYAEHQKELAGADGEKTFNEVFGDKARIVIVLYRDDWGKTKWTRIEETAIRNRGHDEGYDFTLFIQLDPASTMPKWLPKTRIYYNFNRWGLKGIAPVIEQKIHESGGKFQIETIENQALKLKRALILENERTEYFNNNKSYNDAFLEFENLFQMLEKKTTELEDPSIPLQFGYDKLPTKKFAVGSENYSLCFKWRCPYTNTLDDSELNISLAFWDRGNHQAFYERQMYGYPAGEKIIIKKEYNFDINIVTKEKGWCKKTKKDEFYNSEQIMNEWLQIFLEKISKYKLEQIRKK